MPSIEQSWAERLATDDSLRRFVDAEICRAHVELHALRVECAHWKRIAEAQDVELSQPSGLWLNASADQIAIANGRGDNGTSNFAR